MSKTQKENNRLITQREAEVWESKRLGATHEEIAQAFDISIATVTRELKSYRDKACFPENIKGKDKIDELVPEAWMALKECLSATKLMGKDAVEHPDYRVRLDAAAKILSAKGLLVEKSEVDVNANIRLEVSMKEKLTNDTAEGLKRFGVVIPNISTDN